MLSAILDDYELFDDSDMKKKYHIRPNRASFAITKPISNIMGNIRGLSIKVTFIDKSRISIKGVLDDRKNFFTSLSVVTIMF